MRKALLLAVALALPAVAVSAPKRVQLSGKVGARARAGTTAPPASAVVAVPLSGTAHAKGSIR